jgi:glycosyltransferase involved in cell wall biosynthesis
MSRARAVSVIMPTRALCERAPLLRRAIESVLAQEGVDVIPLVIVNGLDSHPPLLSELCANRRLRIVTLEEADLPNALRVGRDMVDTAWFTELDDDDLLLPGALSDRIRVLEEGPELDGVVTNGLRRSVAGDALHINDMLSVQQNPLRSLFQYNWLLPGAWLCRTDSVGPQLFEGMPRFLECTYLAIRLATGYRIKFLDLPTVVWHEDTPFSESKSTRCMLGQAAALRRILQLDLPLDVQVGFRARVLASCHHNARIYLEQGNLKMAWCWHFQSLQGRNGWRYLFFSYRLLCQSLWSRL